jgi:hypothetical protein
VPSLALFFRFLWQDSKVYASAERSPPLLRGYRKDIKGSFRTSEETMWPGFSTPVHPPLARPAAEVPPVDGADSGIILAIESTINS